MDWRCGTGGCAAVLGLNADWGINYWPCCSWWGTPCTRVERGTLAHWGLAGSLHPSGCQVALGDASVRFLSETTAYQTRMYLARIADGNPIGQW